LPAAGAAYEHLQRPGSSSRSLLLERSWSKLEPNADSPDQGRLSPRRITRLGVGRERAAGVCHGVEHFGSQVGRPLHHAAVTRQHRREGGAHGGCSRSLQVLVGLPLSTAFLLSQTAVFPSALLPCITTPTSVSHSCYQRAPSTAALVQRLSSDFRRQL
jgi:hypothetical protein